MKTKISLLLAAIFVAFVLAKYGRSVWFPVYKKMVGKETVAQVMQRIGQTSEEYWKPKFSQVGLQYPPNHLILLALKQEKQLEIWSQGRFVAQFDILAASGQSGPKFEEGDRQVPEGVYKIVLLNPNSSYHLSMKINYPNELDMKWALQEGRTNPGSNIFIHGKDVSIGCLAMGDDAIEKLFALVSLTQIENCEVIIVPHDFRKNPPMDTTKLWVKELYAALQQKLQNLQR